MARALLAFLGAVGSLAAITLACSDSSAPRTELAHGILGAGELATPDASIDNVARSSDGGKTWQQGPGRPSLVRFTA
jgi:hypothetical protein